MFGSALRLAAVLATLVSVAPSPAAAQGWGFFGGLFGGGQPQQVQAPPTYRRYYAPPRRRVVAPRVRPSPTRTVETPPAPKVPPPNASHFVAVFGDSLGQILANGLDDALSDRTDVAVLHKARDATGLVREDYYDWPKAIDDLLAVQDKQGQDKPAQDKQGAEKARARAPAHEKVDVAVMMIGTNDRQTITEGGKTFEPGTDAWTALYTQRALAIAEAFKKHNIPLIWVGVPITKDDAFADAMTTLNDIYRGVAAKTGAVFVDTWEAFSDDDGDFSTFGPNVNGQTVRLRSADGIHFTRAGGLKLAHFVVTHVRRALDREVVTPAVAVLPPAGAAGAPADMAILKPDAGPVQMLTQAPVAADGQLRAAVTLVAPATPRDALVDTVLVKGEAQPTRAGRADDAVWPAR